MPQYGNGTVSVSTTATLLLTVPTENDGVIVHNRGDVSIFLGSASVTADQTSTGGLELSVGEKMLVPSYGNNSYDLYGITESGTSYVSWLAP